MGNMDATVQAGNSSHRSGTFLPPAYSRAHQCLIVFAHHSHVFSSVPHSERLQVSGLKRCAHFSGCMAASTLICDWPRGKPDVDIFYNCHGEHSPCFPFTLIS